MTTLRDDEIVTSQPTQGGSSRRRTPTVTTPIRPTRTPTTQTRTPTTPTRTPTTQTQIRTARTPRRAAEAALARCLDPFDAATFSAEHWSVVRSSSRATSRAASMTCSRSRDVERLVCSTAIRYPALRLVREGRQLAVGEYTSDLSWRPSRAPTFPASWPNGRPGRRSSSRRSTSTGTCSPFLPPARGGARLRRAGERLLHPARSQGFAVHHDTHDVLVLQVAGEKRWLLYEPLLELPLKHQRYSPALAHGQPTDDLVLRAGDTLYLPRGWLHQAETSTTDSLHLTRSVSRHTHGSTR